jgi:hypothetical protein
MKTNLLTNAQAALYKKIEMSELEAAKKKAQAQRMKAEDAQDRKKLRGDAA